MSDFHRRRSSRSAARVGLALFVLLLAGCSASPDVVLIVVDTLRADRLGLYGYERNTSPALDRFAQDALIFENAITPAPWTSPAMASLLTGLSPSEVGITEEPGFLPTHLPTLPKTLRARGYRSIGIVSHLFVTSLYGFNAGFEHWHEGNARGHGHVSSPGVTARAFDAVRTTPAWQPLFLFAHYFDPHYDYLTHPRSGHDLTSPYRGPLAREGYDIDALRDDAEAGRLKPRDVAHLRALYDSEIRFTDAHIGALLDLLRERGRYDESLIVVTADHGEALLDRPDRWVGHTKTLFQELVRVPLLIKLPHSERKGRIAHPVSTQNLFATVMHSLGEPGTPAPGRSLLADLDGGNTAPAAFSETRRWARKQSIARGQWKLIRDLERDTLALFDLQSDPGETRDRSGEQASLLAQLDAELREWAEARDESRAHEPALSPEEVERLRGLGYVR